MMNKTATSKSDAAANEQHYAWQNQFNPAVIQWFTDRGYTPTKAQLEGWQAIGTRQHSLIIAPTGSGKTLAGFTHAINRCLTSAALGKTRVLYISPLKALSHDICHNLQIPLAEICALHDQQKTISCALRTGDTNAKERRQMWANPPDILATTPESLYILLGSVNGRAMLDSVDTVIIDEIHSLFNSSRGSHLGLSLERLAALVEQPFQRIGLSASVRTEQLAAHFLTGYDVASQAFPHCNIINAGRRNIEAQLYVPPTPLEVVMSNDVWQELYQDLKRQIESHRTVLIFVNTRRMAERIAHQLGEMFEDGSMVGTHHGSLSSQRRHSTEAALREGRLKALVCTASLELGIDIGHIDIVCQIGSPRNLAAFMQRAGRAGHGVGRITKTRLYPLSRDDLVECVALLDYSQRGILEELEPPRPLLDILAQQIIAEVACQDWFEQDLHRLFSNAYAYYQLPFADFQQLCLAIVAGYHTGRRRSTSLLRRDALDGRLSTPGKLARYISLTSGGAIPMNADYRVMLRPDNLFLGTVHEDFAVESLVGDVFMLGSGTWQIQKVEVGNIYVVDATGRSPTFPFWLGDGLGRSYELSQAVSELRGSIHQRLQDELPAQIEQELIDNLGLPASAARQLVSYLDAAGRALEAMPTLSKIVIERFFDDSGGMQLVIHSPWGIRVNRAWGLALRKRFCRKFNFELQAAACDNGIVLSLGVTHSFQLDSVYNYLQSNTVREVLTQALLDSPFFQIRWRWNVCRSLAIPRFRSGKPVPPNFIRMEAEDLLALIFPDQIACFENIRGARHVPEHPLVKQTVADCLSEAMDIERLEGLLEELALGNIVRYTIDTVEPSPMAEEMLNLKPYAFLDDTPLEERRTNTVRRPGVVTGSLATAQVVEPAVLEQIETELLPTVNNAQSLGIALFKAGFLLESEIIASPISASAIDKTGTAVTANTTGGTNTTNTAGITNTIIEPDAAPIWQDFFDQLCHAKKAARLSDGQYVFWVGIEHYTKFLQVKPEAKSETAELDVPEPWNGLSEHPLAELIDCRLRIKPLHSVPLMAQQLNLAETKLEAALLTLESRGSAIRTKYAQSEHWCDRRLLAEIQRRSLSWKRRQVKSIDWPSYQRFLCHWQYADPEERKSGVEGLAAVLDRLEGVSAPFALWERYLLPLRMTEYEPNWLDALFYSGRYVWLPQRTQRLSVSIVRRENMVYWLANRSAEGLSTPARLLHDFLLEHGSSFMVDALTSTRILPSQLEQGLIELVKQGLVYADGFEPLRVLKRKQSSATKVKNLGRWSLVKAVGAEVNQDAFEQQTHEYFAQLYLERYGVVHKQILPNLPQGITWSNLYRIYNQWELSGKVQMGLFLKELSGQQFRLPAADIYREQNKVSAKATLWNATSAVGTPDIRQKNVALQSITGSDEPLLVSSYDPLNIEKISHSNGLIVFYKGRAMLSAAGSTINWYQPAIAEDRNRFLSLLKTHSRHSSSA